MKTFGLAGVVFALTVAMPHAAGAQKDGSQPVRTAPRAPSAPRASSAPGASSSKTGAPATPSATTPTAAPTATPTATPTAAPAAAPAAPPSTIVRVASGTYTWCSALSAPPLQRYFSGVFLAPSDTTIDVAGFNAAISAKHHPNPQDVGCNRNGFQTQREAEEARTQQMPAGVAWRRPTISVDWVYAAP